MSNPGSGLSSSVGLGIETTYGTYAAPTQWTPDASSAINLKPHFEQGSPIRAGQLIDELADHVWTTSDATGSVKTEVYDHGMLRWFGMLFGNLTVTPTLVSGSAYTTTFTWGSQQGSSCTLQEGVPQENGTIVRWDTLGAKVSDATFDLNQQGMLEATWNIDGQDRVKSSSSIVSPTYLTNQNPFAWHQCSVKLGTYGSEATVDGIQKVSLSYKRSLANARFNVGHATTASYGTYALKSEPIDNGRSTITGTLDTEYLTESEFVDLFVNQTEQSLIVQFTGADINSGTNPATLTFNFPVVLFEGADPTVQGMDIVKPTMSFVARMDNTNHAGLLPNLVIVSRDTAV